MRLFNPLIAFSVLAPLASAGCYSKVPSGYTSITTYSFQSTGWCQNHCSGYSYYALTNGNGCMCGNSAPSDSDSADDSECDTSCNGYSSDNCGGSNAFQIVAIGGGSSSSASASSSSSSSASSNSGSSTSSAATTATQPKSTITSQSGSTVVQLVTSLSTQSGGGTHIVTVTAATQTSVETSVVQDNSKAEKNNHNKEQLIGKVVGGVIGGLAALSILALAIFFIRRQRQKDRDLLDADANIVGASKKDEGTAGHSRQLSNPFADDFVEPKNPEYLPDDPTFHNPNVYDYGQVQGSQPTKLAVVNPDR